MTIDIQPYLTSIRADGEDNELQHLYTPTDALSRQLQPAKKSRFPFDLQLKVQTVPPPQREGQTSDREQIERFNVLDGLRKYAANHVLLVGRPGSGKSTALQRLLWEEAQTPLEKLEKIPVLVELRQYKTSTLDLIYNFLKRHKLNIEKTAIEKLLDENRLLLLFDGVNELPNETARQDLNTFRQNYRRTPMIFTTRDIEVGGDLGIEKKLEMQPLTQTQMQQFVRAYLPDTGEEMLRRLGEKLQSFAQTPLLLLMLCTVFAETGDIPANLG
ncbi:MAG TPA: NACHT domain-containing protein, partial [Nostocaceae cyanobacterium]|nr:NACHT domain-containing protein [Nostocaceae cyanobacterium]